MNEATRRLLETLYPDPEAARRKCDELTAILLAGPFRDGPVPIQVISAESPPEGQELGESPDQLPIPQEEG